HGVTPGFLTFACRPLASWPARVLVRTCSPARRRELPLLRPARGLWPVRGAVPKLPHHFRAAFWGAAAVPAGRAGPPGWAPRRAAGGGPAPPAPLGPRP